MDLDDVIMSLLWVRPGLELRGEALEWELGNKLKKFNNNCEYCNVPSFHSARSS